MRIRSCLWAFAALLLWVGCDDGGGGADSAIMPDSGGPLIPDAGDPDASPPDLGPACQNADACQPGQICADSVCSACETADQCTSDPRYGEGASCTDGACVACPPGTMGCACDAEGGCAEGECTDGTCVACDRGSIGCACLQTGGCDMGGRCGDDNICVECPAGQNGCACGFNETCDLELTCQQGVCAPPPCPAGTDGCPCNEGSCDAGLACNGDLICYPCANDLAGCPCVDGACEDRLICDADDATCRESRTCEEAACGDHRRCEEPAEAGQAPTCLDACDEGYIWDGSACAEIVGASCTADAPNSIVAQCQAESRRCVEEQVDAAQCGACLAGTREEAGNCVALVTCADRNCAAQNRECTPEIIEPATDAVCAGCTPGHIENAGQCVALTCELLGCAALNRICDPAAMPLVCGDCAAGFIDVGGVCEVHIPANCQPDAPGSIQAQCAAESRVCDDSGAEAVCGGCVAGTAIHPNTGLCTETVLCDSLNCAALGRQCVGGNFAMCGECENGAVEENPDVPGGRCIRHLTCADIGNCPGEGQFCIEGTLRSDAYCADRRCPLGQAWRMGLVEGAGECVECVFECGGTGETGRHYDLTLQNSNDCVCETQTGFYNDAAGAVRAKPCDADGDGWVRDTARAAIESNDPAVFNNARCVLQEIDRFELRNQHGQSFEVLICEDEGLLPAHQGECQDSAPIGLYETERNDSQIELDRANLPGYSDGQTGRALRPEELNGLTRYCVARNADFNDNFQSDVSEHHGIAPDENLDASARVFMAMGFFGELHRGFFVAPGEGETFGKFVIQERSRCDAAFPIRYAEGEGGYWRSCTLNRDASYSNNAQELTPVGYDFGQYSCDAASGTCPLPGPNTAARPDANSVAPHGICEVPLPEDGVWRGMNLHSQFKCVHIVQEADLPGDRSAAPHQVSAAELFDGSDQSRTLQLNRCNIACPDGDADCVNDCAEVDVRAECIANNCPPPDGDADCVAACNALPPQTGCLESSERRGGIANPMSPVLACNAVLSGADNPPIAADTVGFASVRYHRPINGQPNTYRRGCIDEWEPSTDVAESRAWKVLCPGYAENPTRVRAEANPANFGEVMCGCGISYGGPGCRVGCNRSLYGGIVDNENCPNGYCPIAVDGTGGRRGYWACGGFSTTTTQADPFGNYDMPGTLSSVPHNMVIIGGVLSSPFEGGQQCENQNCADGYTVRSADMMDRVP